MAKRPTTTRRRILHGIAALPVLTTGCVPAALAETPEDRVRRLASELQSALGETCWHCAIVQNRPGAEPIWLFERAD